MNPPRWAESLLFTALSPRDRGVITGDLLEAYREDIVPCRGVFRARLWYVWQTLTLVAFLGGTDMWKSSGWLWVAGGVAWAASITAVLVRSGFTPPSLPPATILMDAGLSKLDRMIVGEKSAFPKLAAIWAQTPVETLKAWHALHIADNAAP